jgi:hypothetical protein
MVLGQALAVFQAFSLAKLRNLRLLSQKLKFWESLIHKKISYVRKFGFETTLPSIYFTIL